MGIKDLNSEIIEEIKDSVFNLYRDKLNKLILFGSYARNDAELESDIDILILTDYSDAEIRKIRNELVKTSSFLDLKYEKVFSFLVVNNEDFNKYSEFVPFYQNIQSEGIPFWTKV
jgi:predicted nucleotidyltransferase